MTSEENSSQKKHDLAPPPEDFDPLAAHPKDLFRYGLPQRPDPQKEAGLSALWEQRARRYRTFQHLQAEFSPIPHNRPRLEPEVFRLQPLLTCGYSLDTGENCTSLAVTWTVPNLRYTPSPLATNRFRTFVSLGFLDVHVEMTIDTAHNVTANVTRVGANGVEAVGLPVQPGDVISAVMCLAPKPPGDASYILANETSTQTINFRFDSGFPPATSVSVGISRDIGGNPSLNPLARFGIVYFDEIAVFTTGGTPLLTDGQAVTMLDVDGRILARPVRLNGSAFKIVGVD